MNINTIGSALIAGAIAFLTGAMALLQTAGPIAWRAWAVLAIGTAVTVLKDNQTLWTRVAISKATGVPLAIPDKYLPPATTDSATPETTPT